MIKKYKKFCRDLNYIYYYLLIVTSTITRCVSLFYFASLVGIPIRIISSAIGLNIFTMSVGIKKYKLIYKKEEEERW